MTPSARRRGAAPGTALAVEAMKHHAADAAQLLKALGNERRLLILCNLLERPMSVGELNRRLDLSQSALSQHLALLREAGLLETRREAQSVHYSLPSGPVTRVMALLQDIYCAPDPGPERSTPGRGRVASCQG
jgi:ArsR family transcriptional regulator, virulence genes transcriptional regulator